MQYASFWSRLGASLVDVLVTLPLAALPFASRGWPTPLALVVIVITASAWPAYNIYFHGRFGQTLGKRALRVRVYLVSGDCITWRAAWLRHAPDVVFGIIWGIGAAYVVLHNTLDMTSMTLLEWSQAAVSNRPAFVRWSDHVSSVWTWSELLVMLLNKSRRALHDFLAGTVVLRCPPTGTA